MPWVSHHRDERRILRAATHRYPWPIEAGLGLPLPLEPATLARGRSLSELRLVRHRRAPAHRLSRNAVGAAARAEGEGAMRMIPSLPARLRIAFLIAMNVLAFSCGRATRAE